MITVRTDFSEEDIVRIIKLHYRKPFNIQDLSSGDIQMFAERYAEAIMTESRSVPIGKLAQLLVNELMWVMYLLVGYL